MQKKYYDLSQLKWSLSGYNPLERKMQISAESGIHMASDVPPIPAPVPGSVQKALLDAGIISDWNYGLNSRQCEWVENRHWIYTVTLPSKYFGKHKNYRLNCEGLDYCGHIYLNNKEIYSFANTHKPHVIDLTPHITSGDAELKIIFTCPPRWLGQCGCTSEIKEWKTRFNYEWDWISRVLQQGIWNTITLEAFDDEIECTNIFTDIDSDGLGVISIKGRVNASPKAIFKVRFSIPGGRIDEKSFSAHEISKGGIELRKLRIKPWWPNDMGQQPLYGLELILVDEKGKEVDVLKRRVGFKKITWGRNLGAREDADSWICHANGKAFFLQGINWTPVRPNYADVTEEMYRQRLELYKSIGVNILRVWGGAFLEKKIFYDICDELGILVWQEFPLSSSGIDNYPPDDAKSIEEQSEIARSYISRRQHHVSHVIWCGGNELMSTKAGPKPVDITHPMIRRFSEIAKTLDPVKRFLTSTPSGPSFGGEEKNYGKGMHWAVNGPWNAKGRLEEHWMPYWDKDDALIRTETGSPGPSSLSLTNKYKGDLKVFPCSLDNPLWRRQPWWCEWEVYKEEKGHYPVKAEDYIEWGQKRQADALSHAVKSCKGRFPRCGGIFIWMGHDCFPCTANTSIIDFDGNLKPAGKAVAKIFKTGF